MNQKMKRKAAALRFVNKVRKALGKKPLRRLPLGIPKDDSECSLALAIEDSQVRVDDEGITFPDNPVKVYVLCEAMGYDIGNLDEPFDGLFFDSVEVSKFVQDYDNCKYPKLVDVPRLLRSYKSGWDC